MTEPTPTPAPGTGTLRILPEPVPADTITRYVWAWREDKDLRLSNAYPTPEEARRIGRPGRRRCALIELVLPRQALLDAIQQAPDE